MNRTEIIETLSSPEAICCESCSERYFNIFSNYNAGELIESLRAITCILGFQIMGDAFDNLEDTHARDQWVAAMCEIIDAHRKSIVDSRQWDDDE